MHRTGTQATDLRQPKNPKLTHNSAAVSSIVWLQSASKQQQWCNQNANKMQIKRAQLGPCRGVHHCTWAWCVQLTSSTDNTAASTVHYTAARRQRWHSGGTDNAAARRPWPPRRSLPGATLCAAAHAPPPANHGDTAPLLHQIAATRHHRELDCSEIAPDLTALIPYCLNWIFSVRIWGEGQPWIASLGKFWMDPGTSLSLCYFTYLCYFLHLSPPTTIYLHSTIYTNSSLEFETPSPLPLGTGIEQARRECFNFNTLTVCR
jgi:hypothetical protein